MANEEWETASESSDLLSDRHDTMKDDEEQTENGVKKGYPNQRPNRRANESADKSRNRKERSPVNGRKMANSNRKENVPVYRVDQVIPQDPQAIENAISSAVK
jgi:hypothetical protein